MAFLNIEIKARCSHAGYIKEYLTNNNAVFIGVDHQTDTYFNVASGRLKLREGNIENNLIFYDRQDKAGPKDSNFILVEISDPFGLKDALKRAVGIKIIIKKQREIYFIDNVKFHIDEVFGLGSFVEIEASNKDEGVNKEKLQQQCEYYLKEFGIEAGDLIEGSYSDLMLEKTG